MAIERRVLMFTGPRRVEVVREGLDSPHAGEAVVEVMLSGISAGTEMLVYRNEMPPGMAADSEITNLGGELAYPLRYGYSTVGRVMELGAGVDATWLGRRVFSFQPHGSHFVAPVGDLLPLPDKVTFEDGVFLPNMETAVSLVQDGRPMLGEKVVVIGQGVVGLLTTALLSRFPLGDLLALDGIAARRDSGLALGAHAVFDPSERMQAEERLSRGEHEGADLVYELSGSPAGLDLAIQLAGYGGRVVVGSWYGSKRADLDLGGKFHRQRIQLISSQVSTIAPGLRGQWGKARRFDAAWQMVGLIQPSRLITHRISIEHAEEAYGLLDTKPEDALQVVFSY